jgi:uncharacterized protein YcbX
MTQLQLSQIWVYPVKSMVGATVDECSVSELGLVGDRVWAVRDLENGGIRGAKKFGGLMKLSASFVGESNVVVISLPDGTVVRSDDSQVNALISKAIGVSVQLEALRPATDLDHYRRGAPGSDDMMEELRNIFGRDIDEPLPDFSVFPPEVMEFESPPGTYYDCWPLMIMSTSAVRSMQEALPDSVIDVRRFRPSLVIDTGDQTGHPEFSWVGKTARIGECELEFQSACPRCVMVTREVGDDLPADRAILRHIVRDLDQNVGVYAKVTKAGTIKTTDQLTFLS